MNQNRERDPSFHTTGILQKNGRHIPAGHPVVYKLTDIFQIHRTIPDHFSAHVNPPVLKIDERVVAEVIVMMMTMDHPAIECRRVMGRIMNQQEPETTVIKYG
jgi:hypothetical protein